jgi:basic membrane protein A
MPPRPRSWADSKRAGSNDTAREEYGNRLGIAWQRVYGRRISRWIVLGAVAAAAIFAVAGANAAADDSRHSVGLVLEQVLVGRETDPFQYDAFRALKRTQRKLPIQAKAVSPSPTGANTYVAAFSWLARQRFGLVIGVGDLEGAALSQTARRFRHQNFAILDVSRQDVPGQPANVEGTIFHSEQAAYLAGFVAAKMARGPRPHTVSSVGGWDIPGVDSYIAGFRAGAKRADPKIRLLNHFTYNFTARPPCANAARDQIDRGSTVVFDVAGACGIGALKTAQKRGAYGIGVDIDQSYLGDFVLTSVIKNLDLAEYKLGKPLLDGRVLTGGNLSFDLSNHGVGLGRFSPKVPLFIQRELIPLRRQIMRGKIRVPSMLSPSG